MKVRVVVTISKTMEVKPEDYDLEADASDQDILEAVEKWIEENIREFASSNYAGNLTVTTLKEEASLDDLT